VLDGRYLDRAALDELLAAAGRAANATAQEKPTVAMIGTGTLGGMVGPVIAGLGYPLIYGSREPDRESVRALVARSGVNASAALPHKPRREPKSSSSPCRLTCSRKSRTASATSPARSSLT
jgi:threonine dehydrogenase-like Zn-dependent dehydrogenase